MVTKLALHWKLFAANSISLKANLLLKFEQSAPSAWNCIEQKKTNSDHSHNPPTNKHTHTHTHTDTHTHTHTHTQTYPHTNIPTCIHINTLSHPQTRNNEYVNVIDNSYIHQLPMKTDLNQKTTTAICTRYISEFLHYFQGGNSF